MAFLHPRAPRGTSMRILLLVVVGLLFTQLDASAQTPPPQPSPQQQNGVRLARIDVTGLERLKPEQVVTESGLQVGQAIDADMLDAAAERLLNSGLFKKLSYRFSSKAGEGVVTFVVEEAAANMPVVFDNFIWFTNDELLAAVRKHLPSFDGTAPEAGGVTSTIGRALTELLRERKIAGEVEHMLSATLTGQRAEHVFSVKGAGLRVCKLSFPGATAIAEQALVEKSSGIFNNEYSRGFVMEYAASSLAPLYHERGYLRANFHSPEVALAKDADCAGQLSLSLPVDEGSAYVWQGAEWNGASGVTAQELDAALGMRARELANGAKIANGLNAVRKLYARRGYLAPRVAGAPEFDDESRSVLYRFNVEEGPQYRMGELIINGLSEKDTNDLRTRWRLAPREVYDSNYPAEFLRTGFREFVQELRTREGRTLGAYKVETSEKPDRERLTVDVTITVRPDEKKPSTLP
ncbi:MAG TPA: POTRA domain-containing protein [Pyrinomonadaceae bacterium]|nr:POTRA domain-containing protein [Pyrinomonadaceae bacterium]